MFSELNQRGHRAFFGKKRAENNLPRLLDLQDGRVEEHAVQHEEPCTIFEDKFISCLLKSNSVTEIKTVSLKTLFRELHAWIKSLQRYQCETLISFIFMMQKMRLQYYSRIIVWTFCFI